MSDRLSRGRTVVFCSLLITLGLPNVGHASNDASKASRTNHAITLSPIHLLAPIGEFAWESRIADSHSLVFIGGFGEVTYTGLSTSQNTTYSVWELGCQYRTYVMGDFDEGMQLGVEALYLDIQRDDDEVDIEQTGEGLAVGPFIGYKNTSLGGFVFDTQFGFQYAFLSGEESVGGQATTEAENEFILLLNLNIGYGF